MEIDVDKIYEFRDTLKNVSYDEKHNKYLSDSDVQVISFDAFKRYYCNHYNRSEDLLNSVDAVFIEDNRIVFIEFKNGKIDHKNIKYKIKDSILMCSDILDVSIRYFREHASAVLVYNINKYPLDNQMKKRGLELIKGKIIGKSNKKELVRFGLDMYKGLFFREVHTYTQEEFNEYIKNNLM